MLNKFTIIGIDPGKSGAIVGLHVNGQKYEIETFNMPETVHDIANIMINIKDKYPNIPLKVYIEQVHAFPKQGVVSVWKFAQNYGELRGIIATLKIPFVTVNPNKWMKFFGTLPKEKKARKVKLKELAQSKFPEQKITFSNADAVMIAVYGVKQEFIK